MSDLNKIDDVMDLDRTNQLFDSAIRRADANGKEKYTEEDVKFQRLVTGFGNMHINSAKVKLSVVRMRGYQANTGALKKAVDRKVRNARKYPRSTA